MTGMMWFDDSNDELRVKVLRAIKHYENKYGRKPKHCQVNKGMVDGPITIDGLQLEPVEHLIPGHMLLDIEPDPDKVKVFEENANVPDVAG